MFGSVGLAFLSSSLCLMRSRMCSGSMWFVVFCLLFGTWCLSALMIRLVWFAVCTLFGGGVLSRDCSISSVNLGQFAFL